MKKLIFAVTGGLLISLSGFGQGYVQFQNLFGSRFYIQNYGTGGTNLVTSGPLGPQDGSTGSTGVLDVGLYWSTSPFSDLTHGTLAGIENIGTTPGELAGNNNFGIAGTTPGEQVYIQIYAWDSTYADPFTAYKTGADFGASSAGQQGLIYGDGYIGQAQHVTLGSGIGPNGTQIFAAAPGNPGSLFGATLVLNTPEPGTVVIGGAGAVALLLLRRRRRSRV